MSRAKGPKTLVYPIASPSSFSIIATSMGAFDRVVSVGMFEHVGMPNYLDFFDIVSRLLAPDGLAVIHSIGRMMGRAATSSWIHKYIFPWRLHRCPLTGPA